MKIPRADGNLEGIGQIDQPRRDQMHRAAGFVFPLP